MFKCCINIKINQNEMRKYSKSSEFDRLGILAIVVEMEGKSVSYTSVS